MIEEIELLDKKYQANQYNGNKINHTNHHYTVISGEIPILLSAPHAVNQGRDGKIKKADIHTGGITEYLCKKCNCYGIIRNYNELDDPNYDNFGVGLAYKEQILKIVKEKNIKLVLDIHGCNSQHNFDFDIGTNNKKNLNGQEKIVKILKDTLNTIGKTEIDNYFKASLDGNISKYISHNSNIPSIQLEISSKFRTEKQYLEQFIMSLQKVIETISNR